jgi:hypothetical protein
MPAPLNDLFAPAYQPNDPQAVAALDAWRARNANLTRADVEATRMPTSFNTGNPAGMVDPAALQAMAQGGHYDMDARRNAIAAQVQANQAAAAAAPAANDPWTAYWRQFGYTGAGPAPGGPITAGSGGGYKMPDFSA